MEDVHFKRLVHSREIRFAGNRKLKIYGRLNCASGRRIKKNNRVFFSSEEEATRFGYRPCAKCMPMQNLLWRLRAGPPSR
ncbi:MAG: Ada metal-binding domain-containing protein [Cyclobacteriaceae bacterium]